MKVFVPILLFTAVILCGCGTAGVRYDSVQRPATKRVDVFREAQRPARPYKVIGMLTDDGRMEEKTYLEGKFAREAKKMGGDGLVFAPFEQTSEAPAGWEIYDTFAYKAYVIVYDSPSQVTALRP